MHKGYTKIISWIMLAYVIITVGFYAIAHDQLNYDTTETGRISPSGFVGEILSGTQVRQKFTVKGDELLSLSLRTAILNPGSTAHLTVAVENSNGEVLITQSYSSAEAETGNITLTPSDSIPVSAQEPYYLVLSSDDGIPGNAITAQLGNSISTGKVEVPMQIDADELVLINGEPLTGKLCYTVSVRNDLVYGQYYWYAAVGLGIALAAYLWYLSRLLIIGKPNGILRIWATAKRYRFLIEQLVGRDFKSRYKRSVLGVLWSFLNPLLTMLVQYVVFSTIFRGDIENFPLYLLTGIVTFNFFNEATSVASQSIVANTHLITKVYIPKIIYPLSCIGTSALNLLIAYIPLLGVMVLTGTWPTPAFLLFPFEVICLVMFCTGVGLILATMMVYFKDIQFLWGIITMLWMYATPIFYPETIIPVNFLPIYRLNPLYRFISFLRTILIEGVSPAPGSYLACIVCAIVPFVIGVWVFRRHEDNFIYHL